MQPPHRPDAAGDPTSNAWHSAETPESRRPTPREILGLNRQVGPPSGAATATALYALFLLSRTPELFPGLQLVRPILILAVVTLGLAMMLPRASASGLLRAPETRGMLALFLLAIAAVPTSIWPSQSASFLLLGFSKTVVFFFLLLYCIRTLREFKRLLWAFVGAVALLEVGVLLFNVQARAQVTGTYDTNDLAFVMVCALPVTIALLITSRGIPRVFLAILIGLDLLTIILTKSRGGFITLVVVAPFILGKLRSRVPFFRTAILIAGVAAFAIFASQAYWERITTIWGGEGAQAQADQYLGGGLSAARWELWKTGLRLMAENPLLGVGAGNFVIAEGQRVSREKWQTAHNAYLQIGAELGVGGLALFLFLLGRAVRNCRRVAQRARRDAGLKYQFAIGQGLEISLYAYMVGALGLSQAYGDILYFLIGASVLLLRVTHRANSGKDSLAPRQGMGVVRGPWWKRPG